MYLDLKKSYNLLCMIKSFSPYKLIYKRSRILNRPRKVYFICGQLNLNLSFKTHDNNIKKERKSRKKPSK